MQHYWPHTVRVCCISHLTLQHLQFCTQLMIEGLRGRNILQSVVRLIDSAMYFLKINSLDIDLEDSIS